MTTIEDLRASLALTFGGDKYVTPQLLGEAIAAAYFRGSVIIPSFEIIPEKSRHAFMQRSQELGNTTNPIFKVGVERCFPKALERLRHQVEDSLKVRREYLLRSDRGESSMFDLIQCEIRAKTMVSILEEQSARVALIKTLDDVKALQVKLVVSTWPGGPQDSRPFQK